MKGAAPPDEPLDLVAAQVAEAAGAVVSAWQHASRSVFPRLSSLQLDALLIVRRCPGINLTRLADEAGTRSPAVSRLCDRLEAAGLLRRERPATNRREIELVLTPQGLELVEALFARRQRLFREALSRMAPAERTALVTGLHAFSTAGDDRAG
ncbi:MarR family winged helix-turn-helix transcriptional regulator [Streptomyces albidochromogenes]|uniref:MarR family winged helix-turn-helix transcriptional regulator n=1 Tax=Streptomyces albidochromogenes TaxID=329524 RepID=A0ABW6FM73_9ACTN